MLLLATVVATTTAQQAAKQPTTSAAVAVAATMVVVPALKLRLYYIRNDRPRGTAHDLAQLAVAELAAQEGTAGGTHARGQEAAVLLLAVRPDGAVLPVLPAVIMVVCICRLRWAVVGVGGYGSRR